MNDVHFFVLASNDTTPFFGGLTQTNPPPHTYDFSLETPENRR